MMKDKLYKTNHKTMYYVVRKAALTCSVFLGLAVAIGVPTTVNLLVTQPHTGEALASEASNTEEENTDSNEEEVLSYNE